MNRALLPDRTLLVEITYNNKHLKILGLHSITGCQHLRAKEMQYYTFAESIDEYKPDIIGIDANEPQIDHYELSKMQFFDNCNKGNGCKTFFERIYANGLSDSYLKHYDINYYNEGEYLATSHVIRGTKKHVRYDFLFVKDNLFDDYHAYYDYDGAINAGSDHAAIILKGVYHR